MQKINCSIGDCKIIINVLSQIEERTPSPPPETSPPPVTHSLHVAVLRKLTKENKQEHTLQIERVRI